MAEMAALIALIEPEAAALGFDLVRVRLLGRDEPTLQVMAERPATGQLTIDDCGALSHRISDRLDALEADGTDLIEGAYRLEVSSPGIDRPLTRVKDFSDWAGHDARIVLAEPIDGQKQFKGRLAGIDAATGVVAIEVKGSGVAHVPFTAIADAKLALTDRLIAATRPLDTTGADEIDDSVSTDDNPSDDQED